MWGKKVVLSILICVLLAAPTFAYYKTGRTDDGIKWPFDAEAKYHSPIVMVPGVMGSILVDETGNELWPGGVQEDRTKLALQLNGVDPVIANTQITATEPIRDPFYVSDIYWGFYNYMDETSPYAFQGKKNNSKIGAQGRSYYDAPYDFRLKNEEQVAKLHKVVEKVKKETHSDQVILVVHSMGGYQARMYAKQYKKNVRAIIFLSTPHHGSPKAYQALTTGYNFDADGLVTDAQVWYFAKNWPGPHELMPDFDFIFDENGNAWPENEVFFGNWVSFQAANWAEYDDRGNNYLRGGAVRTADQAKDWLTQRAKPGIYNKQLTQEMLTWRKKFNTINLDKNIDLFMINGDNQTSIFRFTTTPREYEVSYKSGIAGGYGGAAASYTKLKITNGIAFDPHTEERGDKTVSWDGLQWDKVKNVSTVNAEHGTVPNFPRTHELLTQIIEDINHDRRDMRWVSRVKAIANSNLAKLHNEEKTIEEANAFAAQYNEMDGKSERSKKWYADLKGRATNLIIGRFAKGKINRIQITVKGAGDYKNEKDFKMWLAIDDLKVVDSGIGTIKPRAAQVTFNNLENFEKMTKHGMSLGDAYYGKVFTVKNSNLVVDFAMKVQGLVNQFLADNRNDE